MPDPAPIDPANPPAPTPPTPEPPAPPDLGEAGKKALDNERAARKEAEARAKKLDDELAELRKSQMSDQEKAIEAARAAAASEAVRPYEARLIRTEARAAAAVKGLDPDLAVALIDLSKITVTNGEPDLDEIDKALDAAAEKKPAIRIGGTAPKPPTPTVPGGPRGDGKGGQMTREQLQHLSKTGQTAEIERARRAGELDHLLKG